MFRLPDSLRFSLGELFVVALVVGIGMAALRTGDLLAAGYAFGCMALVAGLLVAAIVGRGALQAFAIGFLVGVAVYGGVLYWHGEAEFDPGRGALLSSRAAKPLYHAISEVYYIDVFSGREATAEEAESASRSGVTTITYWMPNLSDVPFGDPTQIAKDGNTYWSPDVRPDRRVFMQAVHLLAALTLGYVAGKLGAALYRRREAQPRATQSEAASRREEAS